ncbi:Fe-S-containing hydro-lyase [Desulfocurvus sp. DL9XJH121]
MAERKLTTPLTDEAVRELRAGDVVFITGTIYTARDAAHKRLMDMIDRGETPPFDINGSIIYYVGPSPAPPGLPIGSAGPTTSYRMDSFAPRLHAMGQKASIGKGKRSPEVKAALKEHTAVYLGATGGAGALLSKCITAAQVIAFDDLGPEAIRELSVENFPVLVINDSHGGDLYAVPDLKAAGVED